MSNPSDPFQSPERPNHPSNQPPQQVPPQQGPPYQQPPQYQQPQYQQPQYQQPQYQQPQGYTQPYQSPDQFPTGQPYYGAPAGDATGGLIPYKNPKALIAYYSAIGGLIPALGLPFAIAAIVLGFLGLNDRKKNPIIKGSIHAWIGIIGGFFCLMLNACIVFAFFNWIVGATAEDNRGKFTLPPQTTINSIKSHEIKVDVLRQL